MIESDKDKNGDTIAGSRQDKIIDEQESMRWLTDKERAYLYCLEYSSDKNTPWK